MAAHLTTVDDTGTLPPVAELLDLLHGTQSADAALHRVDELRRRIAPASVFSIQRNVTTLQDPPEAVLLRRYWSSCAEHYPVNGTKRKTLTPWTRRLFLQGLPFVAEGADELARHFDDHPVMRSWGLQSVVNVPLLSGTTCYATFNVFGTQDRWSAGQVRAIRLLALVAARWVPCEPSLGYRFGGVHFTSSAEA